MEEMGIADMDRYVLSYGVMSKNEKFLIKSHLVLCTATTGQFVFVLSWNFVPNQIRSVG